MAEQLVRIATRESPLAWQQAETIKTALIAAHPGLRVELIGMTTRGDQLLDTPLAKIGGKGLFVKELETALLEQRADMAVHSMKDVPLTFPEGLGLAVICEREDPHDAFVSNEFASWQDLPAGSVVGTSSVRRQCQLRRLRPDLRLIDLRGNVNTRVAKLDQGDYAAIILACAGLRRLGLSARIRQTLSLEHSLPAGGQGALGVEIRSDDQRIAALLEPLHHADSADCVRAERALNAHLDGGCQVPIAAYALVDSANPTQLWLRARVGTSDGSALLHSAAHGPRTNPEALGVIVAKDLLAQGAATILQAVQREQ